MLGENPLLENPFPAVCHAEGGPRITGCGIICRAHCTSATKRGKVPQVTKRRTMPLITTSATKTPSLPSSVSTGSDSTIYRMSTQHAVLMLSIDYERGD